jgi:hypothetical protein
VLDVRADLGAEAEHEASAGLRLEVIRRLREIHWTPRERDRDVGDQCDLFGVLGRERERKERSVRGLGGEQAVDAGRLQIAGSLARTIDPRPEIVVELHGRGDIAAIAGPP